MEEEEELEEELEEDLEEATAALGTVTVNASTTAKKLSNRFIYPYLMYIYDDNRQKKQSIDILVMCLEEKYFHVMMNSSGTNILSLIKMPRFLTSKNRINMANSSLIMNTSKVVAFQDTAKKLTGRTIK